MSSLLARLGMPSNTNDLPSSTSLYRMISDRMIPFYDLYLLKSGSIDLLYCSASFAQKNERWPTNYAELSACVKASNGYLFLSEFERVDFVNLPHDIMEIRCVRPGATNETKFRFDGLPRKRPLPR